MFGQVPVAHCGQTCITWGHVIFDLRYSYLWLCTEPKVYQLQIMSNRFLINQQIFLVNEKAVRNDFHLNAQGNISSLLLVLVVLTG